MNNYKEKYNKALRKALDLYNQGLINPPLEYIFPELKESEDVQMIERLKSCVYASDLTPEGREEIFAWLEKQGEQTNPYSGISFEHNGHIWGMCARDNGVDILLDKQLFKHLDTQGEKKPIFNADHWYVSKVDGKIHNMTYNPTDKVESKFKPGDWIIFNGLILHIDEVVNGYYRTTSIGDGIHNSYDWDIDNAARLWTIQEAKDGDVLVDEDNNIGLYREEKDDLYWHSYIYIGCDNCLRGFGGYHNYENTKPATKEQRDLLFSKMKEAGYAWDNEKKELKKIEPKKLDADKVIGWLKNTIKERVENCGTYRQPYLIQTRLILPYNSTKDLINDFKEDFGL